jgi:hypothetical protein
LHQGSKFGSNPVTTLASATAWQPLPKVCLAKPCDEQG